MAYDRSDSRRDRDWRGSSDYERGRRDERGFFERAGDEIASWFGDVEAERRRREDDRMNRGSGWNRDRSDFRGSGRDRDFDRDRDRSGSRPMNWTSSDRNYRSGRSGYGGYDRDLSCRGGFAGASSPDYMSATGPSFGYGGSFGAGTSGGYGSGGYGSEFEGGDRDSDRSYRPMAGDYGRSDSRSDSPWGRDDYRRTSFAGSGSSGRDSDRHYHEWRQRQLDELDRDYDQYCRERQDRFENDFGTWRQGRMSKRQHLGSIREHMDVVGSDGETVGKVDCVKGDHIVLTKSDSDDNRHHRIDCSMIQSIDGDQVRLEVPAEEAKSRFDSSDDRGLFGRDRDRDRNRGPDHEANLERSFSGTYDES
jgi:hypothetical protein